jgi:type I restriction enzyme S subunit
MIAVNAERVQPKPVSDRSGSEISEGWAFPMIRDILAVNYGKGLKKARRMTGSIPVYGSNGVVGEHNVALTQGPTIIIGRKGTIGAVNFSDIPCWPIDTTYFIDEFNGLDPKVPRPCFKGAKLS